MLEMAVAHKELLMRGLVSHLRARLRVRCFVDSEAASGTAFNRRCSA